MMRSNLGGRPTSAARAFLFHTICPARGVGAAIAMPLAEKLVATMPTVLTPASPFAPAKAYDLLALRLTEAVIGLESAALRRRNRAAASHGERDRRRGGRERHPEPFGRPPMEKRAFRRPALTSSFPPASENWRRPYSRSVVRTG